MDALLNRKHALTNLTDAEFEAMLPQLAAELESNGVLRESYSDSEIQKDWALLLKKDVTTNPFNISATEVAGMKVLRKHMRHFHSVRNYKGHSVESLWTQPCLEKALRFNRAQHSTPYASEIIRSLSFANGLGKVTMYRPLMAKKVVSYLANKDELTDVRVLDVCAGWGGRMIGAKSVGIKVHYTGIDPCAKTYEALRAIRDELGLTAQIAPELRAAWVAELPARVAAVGRAGSQDAPDPIGRLAELLAVLTDDAVVEKVLTAWRRPRATLYAVAALRAADRSAAAAEHGEIDAASYRIATAAQSGDPRDAARQLRRRIASGRATPAAATLLVLCERADEQQIPALVGDLAADGAEVIAAINEQPGAWVKPLLEELLQEVAHGRVANRRDAIVAAAKQLYEKKR